MAITESKIQNIVKDVAAVVGSDPKDIFYADHEHEELSEGAWSISLEGHVDSVMDFDWSEVEKNHKVFIDFLFSWCLSVYPMDED